MSISWAILISWAHERQQRTEHVGAMEVDDLALHPGIVRVARVVNVAHVALLAVVEELLARVRG